MWGHFPPVCGNRISMYQWTKNNIPCVCRVHGNQIDECQTAVEEATWRASEETRGIRFGFLRRLVARNKFNERTRAALTAIVAALAVVTALTVTPSGAAEPDGITRLLGYEMLRVRMIEQRAIDTQPAGYQGVGYDVRIG